MSAPCRADGTVVVPTVPSPWPCMTDREWSLWDDANRIRRSPLRRPCTDCPLAFMAEMQAEGQCVRRPAREPRQSKGSRTPAYHRAQNRAWRERQWQTRQAVDPKPQSRPAPTPRVQAERQALPDARPARFPGDRRDYWREWKRQRRIRQVAAERAAAGGRQA